MTIIAKRFCSHPGCNTLVDSGPCPRHRAVQMQAKDTKTEEEARFYGSSPWKRLRAWHKSKEPLCRECAKQGRITPATISDHIVAMRDGGAKLDSDNLQGLCQRCHDSKRAREKRPSLDSMIRKIRAAGRA